MATPGGVSSLLASTHDLTLGGLVGCWSGIGAHGVCRQPVQTQEERKDPGGQRGRRKLTRARTRHVQIFAVTLGRHCSRAAACTVPTAAHGPHGPRSPSVWPQRWWHEFAQTESLPPNQAFPKAVLGNKCIYCVHRFQPLGQVAAGFHSRFDF